MKKKEKVSLILNFVAAFICFFDFGAFVNTDKKSFAWIMFVFGIANACCVIYWAINKFLEIKAEQKEQ